MARVGESENFTLVASLGLEPEKVFLCVETAGLDTDNDQIVQSVSVDRYLKRSLPRRNYRGSHSSR